MQRHLIELVVVSEIELDKDKKVQVDMKMLYQSLREFTDINEFTQSFLKNILISTG